MACEVYRKQENEVKDLLPATVTPHAQKNDKIQHRVVKSLFSQSLWPQINDKIH